MTKKRDRPNGQENLQLTSYSIVRNWMLPPWNGDKARVYSLTCLLATLIQHCTRRPSCCGKTRKGNERYVNWEGVVDDMIVYAENPKITFGASKQV